MLGIPGHLLVGTGADAGVSLRVAPGGRLVAIVPNDFTFRRDNDHDNLRELITLHGGYRELPDNAFASSGTGVRTVVILADRLDFAA